ncbi:MAG: hypothetical protein QG608_1132 [Actinomycetota bacterium]|nr:hypothetical protein [Actinomycetota bacterium]
MSQQDLVRTYLPVTLPLLRAVSQARGLDAGPHRAHCVTGALREWYTEGDLEELEFVALTQAAHSSLRLLAEDPQAPRLRVVLAVDAPAPQVVPVADGPRSLVKLGGPIPLSWVASIHIDEAGAEKAVLGAIDALAAADAGDDDARFLVDEAQAGDLLWYDVSELPHLLA